MLCRRKTDPCSLFRGAELTPGMSGARLLGGLARVRSKPVLTGRAEFEQLLRRKSAWLQDVEKHPLVLGVPLGRNGGPDKAITMDLGLKNMAQISTRELANSSSEFKQALLDRMKGGPLEGQPEDLRRAEPIPMSVIVKEDVMRLPIATPVRALSPHSSTRALRIQRHRTGSLRVWRSQMHKASLARQMSDEDLQVLQDPFFNAGPASAELAKLVVDAIPDADPNQTVKIQHRREARALQFPDEVRRNL